MIEIATQIRDNTLIPFSEEDAEKLKGYRENQVIRARLTGAKKPRSYRQLKLFWVYCKILSENNDDPNFATKDLVAEWVKIKLRHIESWMTINNSVHIKTKSISFQDLPHLEACGFFDRAFDLIEKRLGVTHDEMLMAIAEAA